MIYNARYAKLFTDPMPSQNTSQTEPEPDNAITAADIRVTADEFNSAMAAIESRREQETEAHEAAIAYEQSTIKIGELIGELKLDVTPEEIYDEVRRSRQPFGPYGTGLLEDLPDQPYPEPFAEKLPADSPEERLAVAEAYVKNMPMSSLDSYDQLIVPRMMIKGIQKHSNDLHRSRQTAPLWIGLIILWILSSLFSSFRPTPPPPTPTLPQSQSSNSAAWNQPASRIFYPPEHSKKPHS